MFSGRILLLVSLAVASMLTACGQATTGATSQEPAGAGGTVQPVLASSEFVVGPNRIALGLIENNVPIGDAAETKVNVRYYKVNGDQATMVGEEEARYYGEGLGPRGVFVVYPTFDTAGAWGLEIIAERPSQPATSHRLNLQVVERGNAVPVGADAPRSKTPTVNRVSDLRTISSDSEPNPRLHQLSVDQAVESGKPSMILFATPGYCETAVCGPGVDVLLRLADTFGDKVNAVHVEVYQHPFEQRRTVPAMREWGLQTEPWLFLVDKEGKIAGRYEGGITYEELKPAVEKLLQ